MNKLMKFMILLMVGVACVNADESTKPIEPDGTVNVPAFQLPPSVYISEEAKKALPRQAIDLGPKLEKIVLSGKVAMIRSGMAKSRASQIQRARDIYPVTSREVQLAGVHAISVMPVAGVSKTNRGKILINLPGGAFILGDAASQGMLESAPVAALGKIEVVSIDYRQAPEATFPAASEDVIAVYRELLTTHRTKDIGIFGCSAGGLLTAQALAYFQKEQLPMPGAAGIFCASADARWAGDSWFWQKAMHGLTSPPSLDERFYYGDHDLADPLMSPIESPEMLKRFPPTLIITASRAGEMSSAITTHRALIKAGVDADLHVWDGLDHAFFLNTDLPEAREAFDVMVRFFCQSPQSIIWADNRSR